MFAKLPALVFYMYFFYIVLLRYKQSIPQIGPFTFQFIFLKLRLGVKSKYLVKRIVRGWDQQI